MTFLLDTNMLIFMIRGLKKSRRARVNRKKALQLAKRCRRAQKEGHVVALSAITVAELMFGAHQSERHDDEVESVQKVLAPFTTLDWDAAKAPAHYGNIRHALERAGQPIGAMDLLIAAHALSLDATLITSNLSEFRRVPGLKVETWP